MSYILLFFPLLILIPSVFSEEWVLGREKGWDDFLIKESITTQLLEGEGKEQILVLEKQSAQPDEFTDLLLTFESIHENERYAVVQQPLLTKHSKAGNHAAWFDGNQHMEMEVLPGSMFYEGGHWGDFSIEFWYYPLNLSTGGEIFHWHSLFPGDHPPQRMRILLENHRMVWDFSGIFFDDQQPQDIWIKGAKSLVPLQWQQHRLSYFHEEGKIVYYVDGQEEVIYFATDTGRQRANRQYVPQILSHYHLSIGKGLSGILDDFFITTQSTEAEPASVRYKGGDAISRVFDLHNIHATVQSVHLVSHIPPRTEIKVWYRISDTLQSLHPTDALAEEWVLLSEDGYIGKQGRFMQYRIAMYPDPLLDLSPELASFRVRYENAPILRAPVNLRAEAGNGQVRLSWRGSQKAMGYRIYVGISPSFDISRISVDSPIIAGNTNSWVVEGLENGVGYFFAVAAYQEPNDYQDEARSMLVFARPFLQ